MGTIIFLTQREAEKYISENNLDDTGNCMEFDEAASNLEYYNPDFFRVVGSWSGELSGHVYSDGKTETVISWWYGDGEGPTITVEGEEVECNDLIGGVYADGMRTGAIDNETAQDIAISCKLNRIDVYTAEDDEDDFNEMSAKLNLDITPCRVISAGDYVFAIPQDIK
jgi:hypothetical protein